MTEPFDELYEAFEQAGRSGCADKIRDAKAAFKIMTSEQIFAETKKKQVKLMQDVVENGDFTKIMTAKLVGPEVLTDPEYTRAIGFAISLAIGSILLHYGIEK